jgi:hypothetical protein
MTIISYINFGYFNEEMGKGTGVNISLRILTLPLKIATKWHNSGIFDLLGCYAA